MKYEIKAVHGEIEYLAKVGKNVFVQQVMSDKDFLIRFNHDDAKKSVNVLGKNHIHAKAYPICFNDTYFFKGKIFDEINRGKRDKNND